jgi:hypothetical protein
MDTLYASPFQVLSGAATCFERVPLGRCDIEPKSIERCRIMLYANFQNFQFSISDREILLRKCSVKWSLYKTSV